MFVNNNRHPQLINMSFPCFSQYLKHPSRRVYETVCTHVFICLLTNYMPLIYNTLAWAGVVRFRNLKVCVGVRVCGVVARERWGFCTDNFEFSWKGVLVNFNDSLKVGFLCYLCEIMTYLLLSHVSRV